MAKRRRNFVGNQVMRDLLAVHPKYKTGMSLWRAIRAGKTFMDTGADCIKSDHKFPEFNRNTVGFTMLHQPCGWGEAYGPVVLTGWWIFTYSGRGAANECTLPDGRVAWLSDLRLPKDVELPAPVEPFQPVPDELQECKGLFFGVRLPRSVPFFDLRVAEDRVFRRTPIEPYDLGNTKLVDGEWKRVPHIISDVNDQQLVAMKCGFKPYAYGHSMSHSCTHHTDTRKEWAAHWAADYVMDLRKTLAEKWREYRRDRRTKSATRPIWVEFNNFGWGIETVYERVQEATS